MVWYFENVLDCQHRSRDWLSYNGHHSFVNSSIKYHGGTFATWDRLGVWSASTKQMLAPFLLFFAIITGANKTPMLEMQRDCIKEDALLGRKYVKWFKNKGGSIHRSWSQVARMTIERVIKVTDGLVSNAGSDKKYLWLYNSHRDGVKRIEKFDSSELLWFTNKYNLTADDGSPLMLNFARMRPTFASRAFETCNGDLVKLRTLLGHSKMKTTQRYVRDFDKENEESRAFKGMTNILDAIKEEKFIKRYSDQTKVATETLLRELRNHKYFTGLGNCLDPYRSPMKGEQAKKRCRFFWSCLSCRHVLVLDTDLSELLSHYYHVDKLRNSMTADVFEEAYGFIIRIIDDDILPRFDKKTVEDARKIALARPSLSLDLPLMCHEETENP